MNAILEWKICSTLILSSQIHHINIYLCERTPLSHVYMGESTSRPSVRKRGREDEPQQQALGRSKIEIGYIIARFRRRVIANDGRCTHCGKQIMSLNELAEYEFDFKQETVVKHADQKCVRDHAVSLDEDVVMTAGICVSVESKDDTSEDEDDGDEDNEQPGEPCEEYDSWESDLLLNEDPIQAEGSRQTGLMVRNHLADKVRPVGQTLAEILHLILSEDRPVHVIEDMLKVARASSGNEFSPNSFHVLKKALRMRSLASVDIHICGACWQYGWKPMGKEKWSKCDDGCTCEGCTCPVCYRRGSISKRFKRDLSGRLEPQQVRLALLLINLSPSDNTLISAELLLLWTRASNQCNVF